MKPKLFLDCAPQFTDKPEETVAVPLLQTFNQEIAAEIVDQKVCDINVNFVEPIPGSLKHTKESDIENTENVFNVINPPQNDTSMIYPYENESRGIPPLENGSSDNQENGLHQNKVEILNPEQNNTSSAQVEHDNLAPAQVEPANLAPAQVGPNYLTPTQVELDCLTPAQVGPDNLTPALVELGNLTPAQVELDNLTSAQVELDNLTPAHVKLDNLTPAQVELDNLTPAQVVDNLTLAQVKLNNLTPAQVKLHNLTPAQVKHEALNSNQDNPAENMIQKQVLDSKNFITPVTQIKSNNFTSVKANSENMTQAHTHENLTSDQFEFENLVLVQAKPQPVDLNQAQFGANTVTSIQIEPEKHNPEQTEPINITFTETPKVSLVPNKSAETTPEQDEPLNMVIEQNNHANIVCDPKKVHGEEVLDKKHQDEKVLSEKVLDEKVLDDKVQDKKDRDKKVQDENVQDEKVKVLDNKVQDEERKEEKRKGLFDVSICPDKNCIPTKRRYSKPSKYRNKLVKQKKKNKL